MGNRLNKDPVSLDVYSDEIAKIECLYSKDYKAESFTDYAPKLILTKGKNDIIEKVTKQAIVLQERSKFESFTFDEICSVLLYTNEINGSDKQFNIYKQMNEAFSKRDSTYKRLFRDNFYWALRAMRKLPQSQHTLLFRGSYTKSYNYQVSARIAASHVHQP